MSWFAKRQLFLSLKVTFLFLFYIITLVSFAAKNDGFFILIFVVVSLHNSYIFLKSIYPCPVVVLVLNMMSVICLYLDLGW